MQKPLNQNDLVVSKMGHDTDRIYLVYQIIDNDFVYLIDGDKRPIANPKKKRQKHLRFLASATINNDYLDKDVKAIIKEWRNNAQRG